MMRLLVLLAATALGLAGCAPRLGPEANCFSLLEAQGGCEFHPVPAAAEAVTDA